ncbi:MAG: Crp/Fnr family transcriptional regulator [Bacteroidales bacterium]|nr:Crp/Fnr family transcriptional regulator [Bacteroidales bacterium]MCF8386747.1 Crp/Fnr family transcriptional regulator [Bacteroidales bacterium]MCF8398984.1 Crp/Fnr family transcriptional regulator [Bacteroidales bacterium]
MDKPETTNCLKCKRSAQCFKKLIPAELEFINQNKTQILYRKGENICKQGAYAPNLLFILDGLVKVYLDSPKNKNINLKILSTSEFIGLSSLYDEKFFNYSTTALKDSVICLIEKTSFRKLLINNCAFSSEIIKRYCNNERELFHKIQSLGNKQMHGRIADTLIYLNEQSKKEGNIFLYLSRKDIAEFAGLSTETTVRLLTELKNDHIIDINGKDIKVLQAESLKEISQRG